MKESNIIFYTSSQGNVSIEVIYQDETFWLTQKRMAELFDVEIPAISKHLKNIFESGELTENAVISKMETTAADGKKYRTSFYNLDAVIAVGKDKGKITMVEARLKAEAEYNIYRVKQDRDYISDFDREIKRLEGKKKNES